MDWLHPEPRNLVYYKSNLKPPLGPVLDRLGDVRRLNIFLAGQVGDGTGQLDALRAMIGAGTELHLLHGRFEQVGVDFIQRKNWRISAGPISELVCTFVPLHCSRRMARVASTPSLTLAIDSSVRLSLSLSKGTHATSTWMSVRFKSGPDILF
jgi:hypothetical protein